jgi:hypothetical protein
MNFSEFKKILGAEPRCKDPEFLRARHSGAEFEAAAVEAERFEDRLDRAILVAAPEGLLEKITATALASGNESKRQRWWPMAMAASLLIAVGAAGLTWNLNRGWDSAEDYVVDHYRHDGGRVLSLAPISSVRDVQTVLSELDVQALPALASLVGVIKICPTPDGRGAHMILETEAGPVTVIYMPDTAVTDQEVLAFDDVQALLVELPGGSAAIIAPDRAVIAGLYGTVRDSIVPLAGKS